MKYFIVSRKSSRVDRSADCDQVQPRSSMLSLIPQSNELSQTGTPLGSHSSLGWLCSVRLFPGKRTRLYCTSVYSVTYRLVHICLHHL
ncbi:hypothetical protein AHF37_06684 [Paragonimus kellicotti]|nr:hypothetical protein AHF37_06684 [Paragonimus kellicotti]